MAERIFTVGHSTHPIEEFVALLAGQGVRLLADVRRFPASRRQPQFGREALRDSLAASGVEYAWLGESLGGRRPARRGSRNDGWRVAGFRGYADHMEGDDFRAGLEELERLARERPAAVMCAEGEWWRCHRRLVADALLARGWEVLHIRRDGSLDPHALTEFAVRTEAGLAYPDPQRRLDVSG